jgi:hypothetical protein
MGKLSLADFKRSNFLLLIIVAVVVLLFVFIPEFIGISKNAQNSATSFSLNYTKERIQNFADSMKSTGSRSGSETLQVKQSFNSAMDQRMPLDQVNYLIDQGYVDQLADQRASYKSKDSSDKNIPLGLEFLPRSEYNWSQLQSSGAKKTLLTVANNATSLIPRLAGDYTATRVALLNYSAGIKKITNEGDPNLTPAQAVDYLDSLDRRVTKVMVEEGVPRAIVYDWSQMSLAPVLGMRRSERFKKAHVPAFNPRPHLSYVAISRQSNYKGELFDYSKPVMNFAIRVYGEEIVKLTGRSGYGPEVDLMLKPVPGLKGVYETVIENAGLGDLTLHVYDKANNHFQKTYIFKAPTDLKYWVFDRNTQKYYLKLPYGRVPYGAYDAIFAKRQKDDDSSFQLASLGSNGNGYISRF